MKRIKSGIPLLAALVIIAVAAYGAYRYFGVDGDDTVRVSGNIELTDVELSFRIPGWVASRPVDEGQAVDEGDIVATLDATALQQEVALRNSEVAAAEARLAELRAGAREQELAQAAAAVERAQARLDELLAGARSQEVAGAEAAVERAKAEQQRSQADYERKKSLFDQNVISASAFDAVRAAFESAQAQLRQAEEQLALVKEGPRQEQIEQARKALNEAQAMYDLVKEGPRKETIAQAEAMAEKARDAVALAETQLGYATLASPIAGLVLEEHIEAGEYVTPGAPVVTVGNLDRVWLRAYVNETDLGRVRVGQKVEVYSDTFPGKAYEGAISFISSEAEFTPKSVQTEEERVKLVYRIKIDIENPAHELKPGMPADAVIAAGHGRG